MKRLISGVRKSSKKTNYLLVSVFVFAISCNEQPKNSSSKNNSYRNIDSIINSLNTDKKKEQFLINIATLDQKVRNTDDKYEILKRNNFDVKSKEYQDRIKKAIQTDSINFIKIMKYLKKYGYPRFKSDDYRCFSSIEIVCMHQSTYAKQLEIFPYLYNAYKDSLVSADSFSFLLNNMHRHKFNESYPQAITNEKNIVELLIKLKLK